MKILVETFVGIALLVSMLFAVDCLPTKHPTSTVVHMLGDAGVAACASEAVPALLCNATTKTTPSRECAICPDPARHCLTSTDIYCATSCDEPLCEHRK